MWKHFVAMGDSFTEGIGDEVEGVPLKSWVEHYAELQSNPNFKYTNLAKRGLLTQEIRETQLREALSLKPDIVSVIAGANDVLKGHWHAKGYEESMSDMIERLTETGAKVLTGTLPDFTANMNVPPEQKAHLKAQLAEANAIILHLVEKHNLTYFNMWSHPLTKERGFWSRDLVHPNSRGYKEIAYVVHNKLHRPE